MVTWTDGKPEELSRQFHCVAGRAVSSLGKDPFYWFVAAAACASVHNVIATSPLDRERRLRNILDTAKAIVQEASQYPDEDDFGGASRKARAGATPKALRKLEKLVEKLLQQQNQQPNSDTSAQAPPVTSTETDTRPSNGLCLPAALVHAIIFRLDSRSAATAAASCKQLAAAHRLKSYFKLPVAYQAYQDMLETFTESGEEWESDGTIEAGLVLKWPLDGSAVAGRDLKEDAKVRTFKSLLPLMGDLLQTLGAFPGALAGLQQNLKDKQATRPPPDSKSTPLSSFVSSKPVPFNTSIAAQIAAEPYLPDDRTRRSRRSTAPEANTQRPPIPAPPTDIFTAACCDVQHCSSMMSGYEFHLDGNLLCYGYQHGYKQRDPGLAAAVIQAKADSVLPAVEESQYENGLFDSVRRTCADSANGLVWCAADNGRRIKAFRAPEQLAGSRTVDAACNRVNNGMPLQYTLNTDIKGFEGEHAGLHVIGTKVFCTNSAGAMFTWDIADLEPQKALRHSNYATDPSASDSEDGEYDEPRFKSDIDMREPDCCEYLEVTTGVKPHVILRLQQPSSSDSTKGQWRMCINRTVLLPGSSAPDTLAAVCNTNTILTYDLETQRIKNLFLGHLYGIQALCPAPAAWPGAENLFATCARSGDVKLWDVRNKGGAAVITLSTAADDAMTAVALAANRNSSTAGAAGSSSSSNQLGAGMICFAGGVCESIWAWDLRAGNAQALYQLSVGNQTVDDLVWHEGTSTLIAACDSMYEDRLGGFYEEDFMRLNADGDMPDPFRNPNESESDEPDEECKLWPNKAKHNPKDFKEYFHMSSSCVLSYTFSDKASHVIPESSEPCFGRGRW